MTPTAKDLREAQRQLAHGAIEAGRWAREFEVYASWKPEARERAELLRRQARGLLRVRGWIGAALREARES